MIEMTQPADRGHDTSDELTEVRTVLSRAENARDRIAMYIRNETDHQCGERGGRWDCATTPPVYVGGTYDADPDAVEMVDALTELIDRLARWRRTGRAAKGK